MPGAHLTFSGQCSPGSQAVMLAPYGRAVDYHSEYVVGGVPNTRSEGLIRSIKSDSFSAQQTRERKRRRRSAPKRVEEDGAAPLARPPKPQRPAPPAHPHGCA